MKLDGDKNISHEEYQRQLESGEVVEEVISYNIEDINKVDVVFNYRDFKKKYKLTKSQRGALRRIFHHIDEGREGVERHPRVITKFAVQELAHGRLSVSVEKDTPSLRKGNLLRFLDHEFWHFFVGKRGGIEAISYPKSYEQFAGNKVTAFGITFRKD